MIGSIISAGADLVGGLLNQNAAEEASKKDWKRTKETLQNQIQWRTQDAVKAGLHPLVGAGISPSAGPPPSTVGDMGSAVSNMGNNLGRAVDAYMDPAAKVAAKAALLDLEQRQANIDLTRSQIAGAQKALLTTGSTPGIASPIPQKVSLPLPGSPYDRRNPVGVEYPGLGEEAEKHYSDIGGFVYGGSAMVNDTLNHVIGSADDWGPYGSRWASVGRDAYNAYMNWMYPPYRGGGGGW